MEAKNIIDELGGPAIIGRKLGVRTQAVSQWRSKIPAERVLPLCVAFDNRITPFQVRPDLYPDPSWLPELKSGVSAA